MMSNAHHAKRHPLQMKPAKSQLFARPPSPLAGGYCLARCVRLSQGTPIHVFHAKNLP
jgi:hypothetical protein